MGKLPTVPAHADGAALDRAVREVLRPLVRLLLARGIPYPALAAMLKEVYFDVAVRDVVEAGQQTTSGISLITGLHRKDVRRMREEAGERPAVTLETRLASEIFTRWISDARYLDSRRHPRALPRLASAGGRRSFEALAESVSRDVRPRALLDEFLRLGLVSVDGEDRVTLNQRAFVPERGSREALYFFGANAHDHLAAAVHNLLGGDPEMLEQGVFGDELSAESVRAIAGLVRSEWGRMLREIVPEASRLDERDARSGDTGMRMRFGIYFYSEPRAAPQQGAPAREQGEQEKVDKARSPSPRSGKRKPRARAGPPRNTGR
ncbi:MAG TPA: DUF6502 family protein [Usitatibacter sp.]|nr:DUF6502 family protein [Usitatibacter sp.]